MFSAKDTYAMSTTKPLKSILKKTPYPAATTSKEDRDREVALYHANLIQERKDVELAILLSTEKLIDFPTATSPYSASNPSSSDIEIFKVLLRPFQPSDYDALILERNINNFCGYTLCPNPKSEDGGGGKYRIIGKTGRAKDFRVVEKEELEKWCSEECARRALYVRVQLSETPAWEREAASGADIELLEEPKSKEDPVVDTSQEPYSVRIVERDKKQDAANLAAERGDTGLAAKKGLVDVTIHEKDVERLAEPPSWGVDDLGRRLDTMHLTLEGHTISFGSKKHRRPHEHEDGIDGEDMDTDWL